MFVLKRITLIGLLWYILGDYHASVFSSIKRIDQPWSYWSSQLPLLLLLLIFIESKLGKWIDLFHAHATIYRIVNKKRFNLKKSKNFWITKIFKLATFFVCVMMIKFIFLFWCSKKKYNFCYFLMRHSLCAARKRWMMRVCPRPKKTVDWIISEVVVSTCGWPTMQKKKVNCILGSRQTDDLKTLFALDPGETKQRLMRLWSVLQVVF